MNEMIMRQGHKLPHPSTTYRAIQGPIASKLELLPNVRTVEAKHHVQNTAENLMNWWQLLKDAFEKYPIFLKEPERLINIDEEPLLCDYKSFQTSGNNLVAAPKGTSRTESTVIGQKAGVEHITGTYSASINSKGPRLYTLKGSDNLSIVEPDPTYGYPPCIDGDHFTAKNGFFFNSTKSGFTEHDKFITYLESCITYFRKIVPDGPLLFLIDGARVHSMNEEMADTIINKHRDIILLYFKHNSTLYCQPLDRGVFAEHKNLVRKIFNNVNNCAFHANRLLNDNWLLEPLDYPSVKQTATPMGRTYGLANYEGDMSAKSVVWISDIAWMSLSRNVIIAGFRDAGVFPFSFSQFLGRWSVGQKDKTNASEIIKAVASMSDSDQKQELGRMKTGGSSKIYVNTTLESIADVLGKKLPEDKKYSEITKVLIHANSTHPSQAFLDHVVERTSTKLSQISAEKQNKEKQTKEYKGTNAFKTLEGGGSSNIFYDREKVQETLLSFHLKSQENETSKLKEELATINEKIEEIEKQVNERKRKKMNEMTQEMQKKMEKLKKKKAEIEEEKKKIWQEKENQIQTHRNNLREIKGDIPCDDQEQNLAW
jgi:hypothetical protein